MKLRIAKKIIENVKLACCRYSAQQIQAACNRVERTRSSKQATASWNQFMDDLGVPGRAKLLMSMGAPGLAFELLMREDW